MTDAINGKTDAFDWIIWSLADRNPREFHWIDTNLELDEIVTRYAMNLLSNSDDYE